MATTNTTAKGLAPPRSRRLAGALAVGVLAAAGSLAPTLAAGASPVRHPGHRGARRPAFPVAVATRYGRVRVARRPRRIVSLSPTATEMLFAIGAGHEVVAVDNDSDYPRKAPRTKLSGYTPNVEAIAGYRPDLVVISYNPKPPGLVHALRALHIPVLYLPAAKDLRQSYAELVELGKVTGTRPGARHVVARMRRRVAHLVADVHRHSPPLTYFYELGPTLYTATGDTFIGSVLSLAGLKDITGASVHGDDYPQLSTEAVLAADPTFVLTADGASPASVAKRPGWSALSAVRHHRVVELDPDVASRWGPRIVDLLARVVHLVDAVPAAKAS